MKFWEANMLYSPNMLKTFKDCPEKYYFRYEANVSIPQKSEMFEKGKKIHALANYFLRGDDITKLEKTLNKEELDIWNRLKSDEFLQKEYVNSEYNLTCRVGQYFVSGRLDALVKDGNDYFILDYKTGAIPQNPKFDYQTMIYLLAVKKLFKEANSITFVYIDLKNNRHELTTLTNDLQLEYEKELVKICDKIQLLKKSHEYPQNTNNCKYCEYKKLCG